MSGSPNLRSAHRTLAVFLLALSWLLSGTAAAADLETIKSEYQRPAEIPFPSHTPYSLHKAALGKMLFYDPRLSGAQNMNCASCHNPSFGYETPVATAIGAANTPLGRHAPTVLNLAWTPRLFWDGRADTLEDQAAGPITAPVEMNGKFPEIVERLDNIEEYRTWFAKLFPGEGVSRNNILSAIATYERTVISGTAPFDRWIDGDENAVTSEAKQGFELFVGKARCASCHTGWNFTDNAFHDIGLDTDDIGRAGITSDSNNTRHAFKTPGLRNLSYRAPFMHNGSMPDLKAVIAHYNFGGNKRPSLSPEMRPLQLSRTEQENLLAFLLSLTAEKTNTPIPVLPN
ncbi:MAG: cytochrome c peroxidase [Parvibaculaceae bacterium]|nr:cytochrome c peroxidase [Parvibaculaceae bacterium]